MVSCKVSSTLSSELGIGQSRSRCLAVFILKSMMCDGSGISVEGQARRQRW